MYVWVAGISSFSCYCAYFCCVFLDSESSLLQIVFILLHAIYYRICYVGLLYRLQNFIVIDDLF